MICLGIDTSNYTTSAALYDSISGEILQEKMLLPVKEGERGLRQSDAVFHHTKQLPLVMKRLYERAGGAAPQAVGVSVKPANYEGSYMPCFLCGEGLADCMGAAFGLPVYKLSHQTGHILAALFSAGDLELLSGRFIAFHVSGGTTDCLLCSPCEDNVIDVVRVGSSLDLKAGQLIDRAGVMMGLRFPCGGELEKLSYGADRQFKIKTSLKEGSCCLSGYENEVQRMLVDGVSRENISRFVLDAVLMNIRQMTEYALDRHGRLPLLFAGGVMSDRYIAGGLYKSFSGVCPRVLFGEAEFSRDNAAGAAVFAGISSGAAGAGAKYIDGGTGS